MHFKDKSVAKALYFLLTNSFYDYSIVIISYVYLILSLVEPGNHSDRPYEPSSDTFNIITGFEVFFIFMFILDSLISSYIKLI